MLCHRVPSGGNSRQSSFVEGFLNGVFVDLAKIGPELVKINRLSFDSMFGVSHCGTAQRMSERVVNSALKCQIHQSWCHVHCIGRTLGPGGVVSCGRVAVVRDR